MHSSLVNIGADLAEMISGSLPSEASVLLGRRLEGKAFEPEFAGKMNFYLAAVDDRLRHPDDQRSIGLIICKN
ncbi:MAG TPA: PDDEXK nuclease domain-containing protein [Bryobacteraceae bacterium]|nr:PDDEXK nuclease domain-containing protein [Bryobacteraceae bacterium]